MEDDKNLKGVYETLKREGYTPPEYEVFVKDMRNDDNLRGVHKTLIKEGYTPPVFELFKTDMFGQSKPIRGVDYSTVEDAPAATPEEIGQTDKPRRPVRGVDYSTAEDAPEPKWDGVSDDQLAELRNQRERVVQGMESSRIESQDRISNMMRHQSKSINNETVKGGLEFNPATGKVEQTYITPTGDKTFNKVLADMASREYRTAVKDWHDSQRQPGIDEMIESAEREVKDLTATRNQTKNDAGFVVGGVPGGVNVRSYQRSMSSGINTETDKQIDLAQSKLIMANQMKRLMEQGEKFGKGPGFKDAFKSWQGFKDGTVGNLSKFANGVIDWFTDPDIMGVLSMSAFDPVRKVAEKMDAQRRAYADMHGSDDGFVPSLSTEEKEVMDYFMRLSDIESKANPSMAFTVGRAIPEIVALGVQLAYNPAAGAGRMAQTATREAVKGLSKTAYRKGAEYAARALGDIAEGVVAAGTTQLGQTLGRAEKLAAAGEDNALGTALMSQASGNFGLMAGKYFAPVGQAIWKGVGTAAEKAGMGTVKGFVDEVLSQTTKNGAADFAKSLHLTGTLENTLGAKLGEALNGVTAGEITFDTNSEHGLFNAHRFAETLTEFAVLDGVMKGYHALGYRTPVYRAKLDMEMASHRASLAFGDPRVWQSILTSLKGDKGTFNDVADQMRGSTTDNPLPGRWSILEDAIMSGFNEAVSGSEGITLHDGRGKEMPQSMKAVYDILTNKAYTNEQRGAALDFVRAAMRYDGVRRGVDMNRAAQSETVEDVEYAEVEAQRLDMHREWESAYERGRQLMEATKSAGEESIAESKAEIDGVVTRMREAYRGIEDVFGNESEMVMADLSEDPWKILDNPNITDDGRAAVVEYINAKAAMDGVSDAANESIEQKRMSIEDEIAMRTHKDSRFIQPATMKGTEQPVYVIKGDVTQLPDGSGIDVRNSSDFIVIYDSTTGEYQFTSPSQIDRIDEPIDPQKELEGAMQTYEDEVNAILTPASDTMPEGSNAEAIPEEVSPVSAENTASGEVTPHDVNGDETPSELPATGGTEPMRETALSRIPLNEQGKPDFAAAETPDDGWDALVEKYDGKEGRAQGFADNMVALRQQQLDKAKKVKSKPTEDPDEWDASEQARETAIEQAQSALDVWTKIAGVSARRKAEVEARIAAERAAREALEKEAERLKAEEEAQWEQQKKKLDSRLRETAEKYRDMPEVLQILEMNTPTTVDEVASVVLSTNKVLLNDSMHGNHRVKIGAKRHVGIGNGEQRKLFGLFASEAKGGKSIERLAEDVFEETCQDYGVPYDNGEALDALIDMIRGANTIGDIRNYITNKRIREAERVGEARREQEMEAYDEYCQEAYGMSGADYDAYEEELYNRIIEQRKDFDEQEFYRNIADEIIAEQRKRAEDESRTGIGRVEETEPAGAVAADGVGGEVLPGTQIDHAAGVAADGRGSEVSGRDGYKEHDQRSDLPGESPRIKETDNDLSGETAIIGDEYDPQEQDKARLAEAEYLADKEADLDTVRHDEAVRDVSPEAIEAIDDHRADMEHEVEPTEEMTQAERDSASVSSTLSYVEPTEAQKAAGNYKMEHRKVDGHNISIENPKGSVRRGRDASGKEWETEMHNDYGYIRGKKGVDGDHIDVFLSDNPEDGDVFVIDQVNSDGTFDEHKVMYGFPDEQSAREAYLSNYEAGWTGLGAITHVSRDEFKKWIKSSKRATKPFAEYKSVTSIKNSDLIGRSLTDAEAIDLITQMEANAEVAPVIELTPENWKAQFGENGIVNTPIGDVKMGENQCTKLMRQGRNGKLGMIKPTLENPDIIIEDASNAKEPEITERDSSCVFVKTFVKSDGSRYYYFTSVTISRDGHEVVVSNQEKRRNVLTNLLIKGKLVWKHADNVSSASDVADGLYSSQENMSDPASEGTVAPQTNISDSKDNSLSSNKQEDSAESSADAAGILDQKKPASVTEDKKVPIEDFGEKILGARKDMLREFSKTIESVTEQSLVELPLSKVFKRPNLKKMADDGVISQDDALLAEAIMQSMIFAEKKPTLTRRMSRKREIAVWAKHTHSGIKLLGEVLSGDAERRQQAIDEYKAAQAQELESAKAHLEKIRGWNPDKSFNDIKELPDPIEVMERVLKGIGYRPGDKVELPLSRIGLEPSYQSYMVDSAGKQGSLWFGRYYDTLDEAIDTVVKAARLAAGDKEVELPQRCFSVRGKGNQHKEPTGEYEVLWMGRGTAVHEKTFASEAEAKAFAQEKNGVMHQKVRYTGEFDSYTITVMNPLTGNRHVVKGDFPTRAEAAAYLDDSPTEINALSLDAIYQEMGKKSAPRSHFYVASSWNRTAKRTVYSVYSDDKNNPWPVVKDFASRKEAEDWLDANKDRLEEGRRQEVKRRNSVVYFDVSEGSRKGEDYRNGKDADAKMYEEAFGFRGVQFGNWTNDADRQAALNQAYDGFMDMASALGVSPRAMSLDGELGLAFGARGSGRAMAHYEPVEVVINLTKTMGAGSLAHEWWHALDNYLSRKGGVPMGYASHNNGLQGVSKEVAASITHLMAQLSGTPYMTRSAQKGDYWGRNTEVTARLFAEWINYKLAEKGFTSPFLSRGVEPSAVKMVQQWNYMFYKADEKRRAKWEEREPSIMPFEEFQKDPKSLTGHPYPTLEEVEELSPVLEQLFEALSLRERESGSMAHDRGAAYGRRKKRVSSMTGRSLFDLPDDGNRDSDIQMRKEAETTNSDIDRFTSEYADYLDMSQKLEAEIEELDKSSAQGIEAQEHLEYIEQQFLDEQRRLEESLTSYYRDNGQRPEDALRSAHDMVARIRGEVEVRRKQRYDLREILRHERPTATDMITNDMPESTEETTETAGGELISYTAQGHLPNLIEGEFGWVERQFSTTGEFSFTGNNRIESRNDVAYLFRALENYSIEHAFAVLVKDGRPTILHLGMGGPNASYVDCKAIRAAYDAFGADKIYFVHNHPSGNIKESRQDRNLLEVINKMFDGQTEVEALIMDTTSGEYGVFDAVGNRSKESRPTSGGNTAPRVYRFDRQVFGVKPALTVSHIRSNEDVAQFMAAHRLGKKGKVSYIVLSNNLEVVGHFHTTHPDLKNTKALGDEIASTALKYGGMSFAVYGNMGLEGVKPLADYVSQRSGGIKMIDAVSVNNGLSTSAYDSGLIGESGSDISLDDDSKGDSKRYRDGEEMTDGERLRAIRALKPIEVERNDMSRAELREIYNNLPSVEKNGHDIEFYHSAFKKIYKDGGLFGQVVPVLDEVLEQSVLAYSEGDNLGGMVRPDGTVHKEHPNVGSFDNYVGKVLLGNKEYYVRTTVQIQPGQTGMHSVFVTNVEVYEKPAISLSYPGSPRARVTDDGIIDAKLQHFFEKASAEANKLDMREHVEELADKLNTPIRIISEDSELSELSENGKPRYNHSERRAKGWWSAEDNGVVVVLPNNVDVADVDNTVVHEVVGHKGLRALVGEKRFGEFLGEIYEHASDPIRNVIDKTTDDMVAAEAEHLRVRKGIAHERARENENSHYFTDMAEARVEAEQKREQFRKEATEEYMSDLGGRIGSEGFAQMSRDELTLWGKIKAKVQQFFDKFLQGLKIPQSIRLSDKDLSYILYKSWKNLRNKGVFAEAEDAVRRRQSGYDADAVTRFRDPDMGLEEAITKMKTEAMQANAGNLQAKKDAMRAIGGNLNHLRQAMARQREYDITTVKSVSDLARVLMDAGVLDDLSRYETKRILGAINNVVGKKDVSPEVQKVLDIMVDNQLRIGANDFGRLLSKSRSRVNERGIEVAGSLDPDGQRIVQVVKKTMSLTKDDIDARIDEAADRMSSADTAIADNAVLEYSGLFIARQYAENIADSKADEKSLRDSIRLAKEDKDAGVMTDTAYREFVDATEDAIRQNKIERAQAYNELIEQIGGVISESAGRAKAWRDGEKYRIADIHHNANSDMEGRPTDEHHKADRIQKIVNNNIARFVLAPLGTFDQMLRMFGNKSVNGEGYLWNRYMRGWTEATEKEYTGYRDCLKELDAKVSEVFGRKMKWGDLISMERGMRKATVSFMDGGEVKEHQLTQGNLLYIYMVDKMNDGRMKLRRMGIEQEDINEIMKMLDPRFIELADWMQEEYLVSKRNKYNEVHKRMFGTSMSAIENYFPLKILANARLEKVDVADDTTDTALPATATGSIIKRTRNNLALDITGADAFSVILDHVQEMERWAAFAEFNRDLNTLLSYKHFRNQVMNMSSVYGGGKTLWNNFRNVCSMAAGAYRPPIAALDKSAVNIAKGVTAAKVSFRMFTALKQFLSMPAYLSDSNPAYLAANIANPIGAWRWAMKELPLFEKRWQSRMSGDPRLMKSEMDWKMWRSRAVEIASRIGMSPNAFVDALTVSIGAHSMYQTKRDKYLRQGYSKPVAEKRAKQDATILFNQTQQSSESAFLSTMQVDRSWLSVLFTVFRNSSMSYTRQLYDALRNLKRKGSPGYKSLTEEFMAKQMMRDGIDPEKADRNARREYRQSILRDVARVGVFGFALQFAWNLGAYLPYLLLGDDEEGKDAIMDDVINHTMFGSIEGLTGGDVMSSAGQMWLNGEGNMSYLVKDMPIASDLTSIFKKWSKDEVSAMNDVINLLAQTAIGVNPQSLTDAVVAVMDYCGDNADTSRECALLICRILNCPPSQLDKIYFDELGVDGIEASKMTPAEIAERYAEYKTLRNAPLTSGLYSPEQKDSVMTTYRKKALKIAKESLDKKLAASDALKDIMSQYDRIKELQKELTELRKQDPEQYHDRYEELRDSMDMRLYNRVGRYRQDIKSLTEEWLKTTDISQRDSLANQMRETRDVLLKEVGE